MVRDIWPVDAQDPRDGGGYSPSVWNSFVGAFPDGQSCLNLAAARLRHIAGTKSSTRRYMNMQPLYAARNETQGAVVASTKVRKTLDTTPKGAKTAEALIAAG